MKSTAKEHGVASAAGEQAREVAGTAREQAAQITQEVTIHGRGLYDETRQEIEPDSRRALGTGGTTRPVAAARGDR